MKNKNKPLKCAWCEKKIKDDKEKRVDNENNIVCVYCAITHGFECKNCRELHPIDRQYTCDNCENHFCERCWNEGGGGRCDRCEEELCRTCYENHHHNDFDDDSIPLRYVSLPKGNGIKGRNGKILTSPRTFGVEIECYYPNTNAVDEIYNDKKFSCLGITEDGSLGGNRGVEFQTPPLAKMKGEKFILNLCEQLIRKGFKVNTDCGLHIHLDANGIDRNKTSLKLLWLFYLAFDDVLLSTLPPSRRNNRFCIPLKKDYHYKKILNAENVKEIEKLWYKTENEDKIEEYKDEKVDSEGTRYNGINFHSLFYRPRHTLEIRYHNGTINPLKILFWVKLHQTIIDLALFNLSFSVLTNALDILTLTEKAKKMFSLLSLPKEIEDYFWNRIRKFTPEIKEEEAIVENKIEPSIISTNSH